MKLLVVLAAMLGLAIAATTQWPERDCNVDHRTVPGNPHAFEISDLAGNWVLYMCEPPHLVFVMAPRCFCGWSNPDLTYGNCSDVNRPSEVHPNLDYMFEYWHPVNNVWYERNCHDTFPPGFLHNNTHVFFNVADCKCDWKPVPVIHGGWSPWKAIGGCSLTCGDGVQSISRTCTNPAPQGRGRLCAGSGSDSQACNLVPCPDPVTHGRWSPWKAIGICSATCGDGVQSISRTCTNPAPQGGGRLCAGSGSDSQACNLVICPVIDGGWSPWRTIGVCSVTCGNGVQSISRSCTNPAPQGGGRLCAGSESGNQACYLGTCPDCNVDDRPVSGDPHAVDLVGNWEVRMCQPDHLVFVIAISGICSDVKRKSLISPNLTHMFEYWHPVDNVWYERDCHDTFPPVFLRNNAYVFFNVASCRCDWIPAIPHCTLEMDIEMNKQPPNDTQGSFVQPDCPYWESWPPPVELATVDRRRCIGCNDCLLKSWHLSNAEKKDACMYFGMYSTAQDNPENYRVVLADSCLTYAGVEFSATFLFEYRANPMSFRVTYRGGVWTYSPGGGGVGRWVDVALCYRSDSWFTIHEGGLEVPGDENNPPEPWADGVNHYLKLQNCHLGICGDILNNGTKYEGCVFWFQVMTGGACPIDLRP